MEKAMNRGSIYHKHSVLASHIVKIMYGVFNNLQKGMEKPSDVLPLSGLMTYCSLTLLSPDQVIVEWLDEIMSRERFPYNTYIHVLDVLDATEDGVFGVRVALETEAVNSLRTKLEDAATTDVEVVSFQSRKGSVRFHVKKDSYGSYWNAVTSQ